MNDVPDFTEFNSNKATLMRIDTLIKKSYECEQVNDLNAWFTLLTSLRREARVKMNKKHQKIREECDKKYAELQYKKTLFTQHGIKFASVYSNALDDFQNYLMDFMNEKGMLLKDAEYDKGL